MALTTQMDDGTRARRPRSIIHHLSSIIHFLRARRPRSITHHLLPKGRSGGASLILLHHELSALSDIDSGWERLLVVHTLPHDVEEWSGGGMLG